MMECQSQINLVACGKCGFVTALNYTKVFLLPQVPDKHTDVGATSIDTPTQFGPFYSDGVFFKDVAVKEHNCLVTTSLEIPVIRHSV